MFRIIIIFFIIQIGSFFSLTAKAQTFSKSYDLKVKLRLLQDKDSQDYAIDNLKANNPILFKVDEKIFRLNDFTGWTNLEDLLTGVIYRKTQLIRGKHNYQKLKNFFFDLDWVVIEPVSNNKYKPQPQKPKISFKKINPTKYIVMIENAQQPFWLIFDENYNQGWHLYLEEEIILQEVSNCKTSMNNKLSFLLSKITPRDIKYLFREPLAAQHIVVNEYANGWYIDPAKNNFKGNFILVLYFFPQSLTYLGFFISIISVLSLLLVIFIKFKKRDEKK